MLRVGLILAILVLAGLGYIQLDDPSAVPTEVSGSESIWVEGPRGRVDLSATLDRIERGIKHPHRNDGSVFQNRERRLPDKPRNYYREFVHPTPGQRGPGAQRVVIGSAGEVYYTRDHYETFERVDAVVRPGSR